MDLQVNDICVVVKPTARMAVGTLVKVTMISKMEGDMHPIYAENVEGTIGAWYNESELERIEDGNII